MKLWNAVCTSDPGTLKKVNQRGGFTAVNAQSQIKAATGQFGPLGKGFGWHDEVYGTIGDMLTYQATFWWKDGDEIFEFPMSSSLLFNKNGKIDDECFKKIQTDAITKALSRLGFNADVFLGLWDDSRYVEQITAQKNAATKDDLIGELKTTTSNDRIKAIWANNPQLKKDPEFIDAVKEANQRLAQDA